MNDEQFNSNSQANNIYNAFSNIDQKKFNDFIFRQNKEFYPNLKGLIVEDNILKLVIDNNIVAQEVLTFDLRYLPGDAWSTTPEQFINIIRINKEVSGLENFQFQEKDMKLLFKAKDNFDYLIDYNKQLISKVEMDIAMLPEDSPLAHEVNIMLDNYLDQTKKQGDTKGKSLVLELKNKQLPAIIPEDVPKQKVGFVNIFILLYGIFNIGFILAIAIMK